MEIRDLESEYWRLCCIVLLLFTDDKEIFSRAYKEVTGECGASIWFYMETKKS